jgi:exosortase/archaeosortase family protein
MNKKIDNRKIAKVVKFFAILFGIIGSYYAIVLFLNEELFEPYINFSAYLSGLLISIFDKSTITTGNVIATDKLNIVLSFGCEGSEALVIYLAGVIAFPADLKYKAKGFIIGGLLLYSLNIIRILILYFIGTWDFEMFDLFHNEILPVLFIIISLISWYIWLKFIPETK